MTNYAHAQVVIPIGTDRLKLREVKMARVEDQATQRANSVFIRRSMNAPLLTKEHEYYLALRWREHSDEAALHELIDSYNRLVVSTANKFRNYGLPLSDLIQEGVIGLLQAANRFEPERDVRFSTYASWWIRSSMQDFILRNWSIVRTGTTAAQKSLFFNLRRLRARIEDQTGELLNHDGREKIAATLNVNIRDVEAMESRMSGADGSLNTTLREDSEQEWQNMIADERPDPEQVAISTMDGGQRSSWIQEALEQLGERERIIIQRRRLTDEGVTLESLGHDFGVSKERVRQLEHRAMQKLKAFMEAKVARPDDYYLEGIN